MSDVLVKLNVDAPIPLMHQDAVKVFNRLRLEVRAAAGFDFLGKCGDIFRPAGFVSKKDGVANRSWHKTGRAFDYDQECKRLVIVSEPGKNGLQYFRTYLKCARQDGSLGVKLALKDYRFNPVNAYVIDFTAMAESVGFKRIPAWDGWEQKSGYNRREFWHYQYNPQRLTWDAAMLELRGKTRPVSERVIGLNDRGADVLAIQDRLIVLRLLPAAQNHADGVYGPLTKAAVEKFQKSVGLDVDGLVGPNTRAKLFG